MMQTRVLHRKRRLMVGGQLTDEHERLTRPRVEPVSMRDAPLIAEIGATTFRESYARSNAPIDMHDYIEHHFTPSRIRREMTQDEARFYLVRSSGGAGGYAKTRFATPPECVSGPYLELQRLYVLSKHKGTGLGGLLLRAILRSSIAESRAGLWLGVDQANAHAISFYRRFGFKIVGTKEFALGASVHPDFVMSRSLRYAGS